MAQAEWSAVDRYFVETLSPEDEALIGAQRAADAAGLPQIAVAPNQGALLQILARSIRAARILEIGTLGGYSTIWLARALPDGGRLISLEYEPRHAAVARANLENAGLADRVEVRVGAAVDNLPGLARDGLGPFDLVFIDADKRSNPDYFAWALKLSRVGSLIIIDNVVRGGRVVEAGSDDPDIQGVRKVLAMIAAEPRVQASAVQTVGSKGWDGLAAALVIS